MATAPWGRHQWDRIAHGELFDGMESWLPWLVPGDELLCDLLDDDAQVILVEPRRVRDRASELLDEESALADALADTWGLLDGGDAPRLHAPFDRLLTGTPAAVVSLVPSAEGPDVPLVESRGWEPILGDAARLAAQVRTLSESEYAVVLCTGTDGGAERLSGLLAEEGLLVPVAGPDDDLGIPGARIVVATVDRGFVLPGCRVAVLTESDVTGRVRPHRQARTRARPVDGFFDDLAPGNYVVHRQHGVALYGGMVTRTMGGATRDYLLLEYRGGDRLYLPTDQIELLTPYAGGDSPTINRLGGLRVAEGPLQGPGGRARDRRGAGRPLPATARGTRPCLRARHAVAGRVGVVVPVRRDHRPAAGHRGCHGRHGAAPARWTA